MVQCESVLVQDHIEHIHNEFQRLLNDDRQEDMARVYALLSRDKSKEKENLEKLHDLFEAHVRKIGLSQIEQLSTTDGGDIEPKVYVQALLEVHQKYYARVVNAFQSDVGFMTALDKACSVFVNHNKIANTGEHKSSELLAKYTDSLLKKGAKHPDEKELELKLTQIMTIFKFLTNKDAFRNYYSRHFARRLILDTSVSDDAETSMIAKLREACGVDFINKLQTMAKDINLSKEQSNQFREYLAQNFDPSENTVEFTVKVLGTSSCPFTPPSTSFAVPQELETIFRRFLTFYESKHQNRKLTWLFQHSRAEIRTNYAKSGRVGYTFQVSTYQMGILLQYNNKTSYTAAELAKNTQLNEPIVNSILAILCKAKVLLPQGGNVGEPNTVYALNMKYTR
jgi:cullin 1